MYRYLNWQGNVVYTNMESVCRACFNGKRHGCKKVARKAPWPVLGECECKVCAKVRHSMNDSTREG